MNIEDLKKLLDNNYDSRKIDNIIKGLRMKRYVTLRINTIKANENEIRNILDENNVIYRNVDWYQDALIILNKDEDFLRNLDIYKEGKIYLQSLSSMLPVLFLNPQENENILDMTAAPGGKTSQIAAITNNKAFITAVEKNKIRADRLKYNLDKLGVKKCTILKTDARYLDDNFKFDKILLDAPCSGSGTLYIYNDVVQNEFSHDLVLRCNRMQEELVEKALKLLKVGGELIYSTCSILKVENEDIVAKILNNKDFILEDLNEDWTSILPKLESKYKEVITILPNEEFEGFFVAKFKKIAKNC